jgi:outer membrane lipoprotein-sorting protein
MIEKPTRPNLRQPLECVRLAAAFHWRHNTSIAPNSYRATLLRSLCFLLLSFPVFAHDTNAFLNSWLAAQSNLKTWTADFSQTRSLKTLKQPLRSQGHLVFAAPNNFRWQLGDPAQTIAIRDSNEMTVIYPRLKRAERYPLGGAGNEPWRDALALMDAGFPTSKSELESRFKILSLHFTNDIAQLTMEPRSALAKKFMSEVQLFLHTKDFSMTANQIQFSDGSILRNDFTNAVKNPTLPPEAFKANLPPDYTIVEPMKK